MMVNRTYFDENIVTISWKYVVAHHVDLISQYFLPRDDNNKRIRLVVFSELSVTLIAVKKARETLL